MPQLGYYLGEARFRYRPLAPGNVAVPHQRTYAWKDTSALSQAIIRHWASRTLPDWQKADKTVPAQIILAKLALKQDINEVNNYLLRQLPQRRCGSTWWLHQQGDYDFTLSALTLILYLFGDRPEILLPRTREHLLSNLLIEDGGEVRLKVPRSLGLVDDTENHLLMTEGSRYLKNRWLQLHGNPEAKYDNSKNGLAKWLVGYLTELQRAGLYEFNSLPYLGFTLSALLNLEAFAADTVSSAARNILDRLNWEYALGSLNLRRFPPFRRQLRQAGITALAADYHTALMKVWMSRKENVVMSNQLAIDFRGRTLWACLLDYHLPDKTADWIEKKPCPYFIHIGHAKKASPEIYAGGPGYLISAGGVHRGWRSLIVARPITLMIDDGARDLQEIVHLAGPGKDFRKWNNSGVYQNFACAAGPVYIPPSWQPTIKDDLWTLYTKNNNLTIAVHSHQHLGIICLFHNSEAKEILSEITKANNNPEALFSQFQFPQGELITYDVKAPKNKWVIISHGEKKMNRDFDNWALMEGSFD